MALWKEHGELATSPGAERRGRNRGWGRDGGRLTPTIFTGQLSPVCPWGNVTQDPGLCRSRPVPRVSIPLTPSGKGQVVGITKFHQHSRTSRLRSTQPGLKETHHPSLTPRRQTTRGGPRRDVAPGEGFSVPLKGYCSHGEKGSFHPAKEGHHHDDRRVTRSRHGGRTAGGSGTRPARCSWLSLLFLATVDTLTSEHGSSRHSKHRFPQANAPISPIRLPLAPCPCFSPQRALGTGGAYCPLPWRLSRWCLSHTDNLSRKCHVL